MDKQTQTKERILDAAEGMFRRLSFPGLRMKQLSDRMGLSRKTLYNHFPGGKRDIWSQCIRRRLTDFAERLFGIVDDVDRDYAERGRDILNIGREAVETFYGDTGMLKSAEEVELFYPELREKYMEALTRFFTEGVDRGLLVSDLPIRTFSEVLLTLISAWGREDGRLGSGELHSLPEFVEQVMFTGILSKKGRLRVRHSGLWQKR